MFRIVRVEILYSESSHVQRKVHATLREANRALAHAAMRIPADGRYHKTDVKIVWDVSRETAMRDEVLREGFAIGVDPATYEAHYVAKIDLTYDLAWTINLIGAHARRYCELYSGRVTPGRYTDAEWVRYLDDVNAKREAYAEILDGYTLTE